MATPAFPNVWHHRKVADTASKPCDICYKPSTSVLVVPDNKVIIQQMNAIDHVLTCGQDFFFVCPSHLKDKAFCSPIIDEAALAAKKKKELEAEVERVKKEFEEKQKRKKEKEAKEKADKDNKDDDKKESKDEKKKEGTPVS
jgi:hypothetical protein